MVLKFWQNDSCYYIPVDNLSAMVVRYSGSMHCITLWDKQDNDWEVARYSTTELCDKAIDSVYQKYVENPNQIVEIPREGDLIDEQGTDSEGVESEVSDIQGTISDK